MPPWSYNFAIFQVKGSNTARDYLITMNSENHAYFRRHINPRDEHAYDTTNDDKTIIENLSRHTFGIFVYLTIYRALVVPRITIYYIGTSFSNSNNDKLIIILCFFFHRIYV